MMLMITMMMVTGPRTKEDKKMSTAGAAVTTNEDHNKDQSHMCREKMLLRGWQSTQDVFVVSVSQLFPFTSSSWKFSLIREAPPRENGGTHLFCSMCFLFCWRESSWRREEENMYRGKIKTGAIFSFFLLCPYSRFLIYFHSTFPPIFVYVCPCGFCLLDSSCLPLFQRCRLSSLYHGILNQDNVYHFI